MGLEPVPLVPASQHIFTVSEVCHDIRQLLEDNFSSLWMTGEISNFKLYPSGHAYFNLKDAGAVLAAVLFNRFLRLTRFTPEDGMAVIVHGTFTHYEKRGQTQMMVDYMTPTGLGALNLAFEQLKARLSREGLFAAAHKKPLPFLPNTIGLVTSDQGAVLHDMLTILRRRWPGLKILVRPVRVQGEGAALEIARAIAAFNAMAERPDVLIVGRGGGSLEDLWAFNEEVVARTIFASEIPMISAVGHETDTTIADFVADARAATPSHAAEMVIPVKTDVAATVHSLQGRMQHALVDLLAAWREPLHHLQRRLGDPQTILGTLSQRTDDLIARLSSGLKINLAAAHRLWRDVKNSLLTPQTTILGHRGRLALLTQSAHDAMQQRLQAEGSRLGIAVAKLESCSPLAVLTRGYAIVSDAATGEIIRSHRQTRCDQNLDVRLGEGSVRTRVQAIRP